MSDTSAGAVGASEALIEKRIRYVYTQAQKEIDAKLAEFAQAHAAKDARYRALVAAGKMDKADYDAWLRGQVFQSEQWKRMRDQVTNTLYQADVAAQKIVNGERGNIFMQSANHTLYDLEHDTGLSFGFELYDQNAVAKIMRDNPTLLPMREVDEEKDQKWYSGRIAASVAQGIVQGDGIGQIATRIGQYTGEQSRNAMLRNARTSVTSAHSAGKLDAMHEMQDKGISVMKRWVATLDDKTRDAHADLDGQEQKIDDNFHVMVDGQELEIERPGDPNAEPCLVYNCRCMLFTIFKDIPVSYTRRDMDGEMIKDMTYREWEAAHVKQEEAQPEAVELMGVDKIKDMIARHVGDWALADVQEVGEEVSQEIARRSAELGAKQDAINAEIEALRQQKRELLDRLDELSWKTIGSDDKASKAEREELADKIDALSNEIRDKTRELRQYLHVREDAFREIIGEIRSVGGVTADNVDSYGDFTAYRYHAVDTRKAAIDAFNAYPTSWLTQSAQDAIELQPHWTTTRAYYSPAYGEIRFRGRLSTDVHEMAHRMEQVIPGLKEIEREFYEKRTAGEKLTWLGPGYDRDEKARFDQFIEPYMGKDYGGTSYELFSMGSQYAQTNYSKLAQDHDMETWVIGVYAALP